MKLKSLIKKLAIGCVNALAVMLVAQTANSACIWVVHQPEFPVEANRFKK